MLNYLKNILLMQHIEYQYTIINIFKNNSKNIFLYQIIHLLLQYQTKQQTMQHDSIINFIGLKYLF